MPLVDHAPATARQPIHLPKELPTVNKGCDCRIYSTAKKVLDALAAFLLGAAVATATLTGSLLTGGAVLLCALAVLGIGIILNNTVLAQERRQRTQEFCNMLIDRVKACIQYNSQYNNKEDILALLDDLKRDSHYIQNGNDDIRVKFVGSQGALEHVLACAQALQELQSLVGAIHTPQPATPLCVRISSELASKLLDKSISHDLDKLLTVKSRAEIIRNYLKNGSELYICYPKGGLEKRSPAEQEVYKEELQKHPKKLFDCVLDCNEIDPDMIGATYLFKDREGNLYSFCIKSRQANDIQQKAEWGFWLGVVTNPVVKNRLQAVFEYLKSKKGPDLLS